VPGQARLVEDVREEEAGNRGEQQISDSFNHVEKIGAHVHVHVQKYTNKVMYV